MVCVRTFPLSITLHSGRDTVGRGGGWGAGRLCATVVSASLGAYYWLWGARGLGVEMIRLCASLVLSML